MTCAYETLGIDKTASKEEIRKAFKTLSKKYHPDHNNGDDRQFKKIKEAYDLLNHPLFDILGEDIEGLQAQNVKEAEVIFVTLSTNIVNYILSIDGNASIVSRMRDKTETEIKKCKGLIETAKRHITTLEKRIGTVKTSEKQNVIENVIKQRIKELEGDRDVLSSKLITFKTVLHMINLYEDDSEIFKDCYFIDGSTHGFSFTTSTI